MITPEQIRGARAMLYLKHLIWRKRPIIPRGGYTTLSAESGDPKGRHLSVIQRALEDAGGEFMENGVRLRKR